MNEVETQGREMEYDVSLCLRVRLERGTLVGFDGRVVLYRFTRMLIQGKHEHMNPTVSSISLSLPIPCIR